MLFLFLYLSFFLAMLAAYWILVVPQPGIKPKPVAVKAQS